MTLLLPLLHWFVPVWPPRLSVPLSSFHKSKSYLTLKILQWTGLVRVIRTYVVYLHMGYGLLTLLGKRNKWVRKSGNDQWLVRRTIRLFHWCSCFRFVVAFVDWNKNAHLKVFHVIHLQLQAISSQLVCDSDVVSHSICASCFAFTSIYVYVSSVYFVLYFDYMF